MAYQCSELVSVPSTSESPTPFSDSNRRKRIPPASWFNRIDSRDKQGEISRGLREEGPKPFVGRWIGWPAGNYRGRITW